MPKSPESEILAKFFADMGEKCGKKRANFFTDFRPSISRKSGRKKFHEKLATNLTSREIKSLRAKGTLISEMRFFPREKGKTAFSKKNPRQRPFSLSRVAKIASRTG